MIELAAPAPIGVGTAACEALSSYVQRLAVGNGTFPGQLVHRLLAWVQEGKHAKIGSWNEHPRSLFLGRNINAFELADNWLRLLELVIPFRSLAMLSANRWATAFPARGVLKAHLAWCPLCLGDDAIPYHRLIWTLEPVTGCLTHTAALVDRCPRCGRMPPVIHERSHVEICPWCAADLRDAPAAGICSFPTSPVLELGNIIAHFGRTDERSTWQSRRTIRRLAKFAGLTNSNQLARAIGTSKVTTWGWWNGTTRISLSFALHAFAQLRASFSSAVIGGASARVVPVPKDTQTTFHLRARRPPRSIDWENVHQRLKAFTTVPRSIAPSLLVVAIEVGIERRTLRSHFPKICRAITRRYRRKITLERQRRDKLLYGEFTRAIRKLASKALPASPVDLERYLKRPGLFNRRYARVVLREALVSFAKAAASAKPADRPRWY